MAEKKVSEIYTEKDNPFILLWSEEYSYIVALVHRDGERTFQGFTDPDDVLKAYIEHSGPRIIYVTYYLKPIFDEPVQS